ncbi:hypothetical protein [Clostridium sp.]|uniref:hypothetical protein n=1 Tax=Clostridium sp. TaxID=1506 RepID=UPI001A59CDA2|nr:hypothetical protein [Clostridium sp.]MBK5242434.1 hypothetical protein [Clostridium sp.]
MKKSASKIVSMLVLSFFLIIGSTINVFASTSSDSTKTKIPVNNGISAVVSPDGIGIPPETKIQVINYHTSKYFVAYLTSSWQHASQYVVNTVKTSSATGSASITTEGISKTQMQVGGSLTVSNSTSIGTYIPADSSRYSKLAFQADKYVCYVKQTYTSSLGIVTVSYGYVYIPTGNTYNDVVYQ